MDTLLKFAKQIWYENPVVMADSSLFIVDFIINETLQIGGLGKRNYRSTVW